MLLNAGTEFKAGTDLKVPQLWARNQDATISYFYALQNENMAISRPRSQKIKKGLNFHQQ